MPESLQPEISAQKSERERTIAVLCVMAAMLCYGTVPIFLRYLSRHLDKWTVNAVRYSTAAAFWLPFVILLNRRRKAEGGPAARRNIWRDALIPAAVNLAGQVGWGASPYFVNAPTISFLIRTSFLFTVLFGLLLVPAERLLARKPLFLVGALVCMGGAGVMFVEKLTGEGRGSLLGIVIVLATAMCWGAYAVSIRRFMSGYSLRLSFGIISLYTAGGLVVIAVVMRAFGPGPYPALGSLTGRVWAILIASAFVGITFSHVMYYRGIHRLGPVVTNGITMASPFVTYVATSLLIWTHPAVFSGETITWTQLLGGLTVVGGGILLVKAKARMESGR